MNSVVVTFKPYLENNGESHDIPFEVLKQMATKLLGSAIRNPSKGIYGMVVEVQVKNGYIIYKTLLY